MYNDLGILSLLMLCSDFVTSELLDSFLGAEYY